jgi:hypothetical protein
MRSLPEHLRQVPPARATSITRALNPYLGRLDGGLNGYQVEDAALIVLAAVYAERGPVKELLMAERVTFDRVVYAINRCPERREAA